MLSPLISNTSPSPDSSQFYQNKRDVRKAREAFIQNDVEASKNAHNNSYNNNNNRSEKNLNLNNNNLNEDFYRKFSDYENENHNESHNMTSGEYFKAFIFGGLDGIVTIFAIVAGCVGANLSALNIITIGVGNLFADAVSMAFGEYVSAKAEDDFVYAEKRREEWEVENCPEEEKSEMIEIYTNRYGFSKKDAQQMVDISFKYKLFFVQHMMVEELGLLTNGSGPTPIRRGLVMFISFCVFGLVPLACFIGFVVFMGSSSSSFSSSSSSFSSSSSSSSLHSFFYSDNILHQKNDTLSSNLAFLTASLFSITTLFVLGVFKGRFVGQSALFSGLLMALNGSIAGFVAYIIGALLQKTIF